ncbi:hypothetical protein BB14905_00965 [Bacillus sp. B14905]|nr:hypothetical protein BB14905_00965 [Bacillus sp. B14905]
MKLRNTTAQNCCIMLWYEERKQVDKMECKMNCYAVKNTHKHPLCVVPKRHDMKQQVNR